MPLTPGGSDLHLLRLELVSEICRVLELDADLPAGLGRAAREHPSRALRPVLRRIARALDGGAPLSRALEQFPRVAGREAPALARVGERSGRMLEAMQQLEEVLEGNARQAREVRNIWFVPTLSILAAWLTGLLLLLGFLPAVRALESIWNPALPTALQRPDPRLLLALAAGVPLLIWAALRVAGRTGRGEGLLRLVPFWGPMRMMGLNALFCRSMGLLLGSEVPLESALALTADILPSGPARTAVQNAGLRVAAGEPPGAVLGRERILSPLVRFALEWPDGRGGAAAGFERIIPWFQTEARRLSERLLFATELAAVLLAGLLAGAVAVSAWTIYFGAMSNPY